MLCDDVLYNLTAGKFVYPASLCQDNLADALRLSQKFCFSDKASIITHSMGGIHPGINEDLDDKLAFKIHEEQRKAMGAFSLPYPYLWIELQRSGGCDNSYHGDSVSISKLGFLSIQDNNIKRGRLYLFWKFSGIEEFGFANAYEIFDFNGNLDFEFPVYGTNEDILKAVSPNLSEESNSFLCRNYRLMDFDNISEKDSNNATFDWVGEDRIFFWSIILLNSKNGFEKTTVNAPRKINSAREGRGKLPLASYNIVDLSKKYNSAIEYNSDGSPKRLHWRRGHFKYRKTGIFWWSPHLSGQKKIGFVDKHYIA